MDVSIDRNTGGGMLKYAENRGIFDATPFLLHVIVAFFPFPEKSLRRYLRRAFHLNGRQKKKSNRDSFLMLPFFSSSIEFETDYEAIRNWRYERKDILFIIHMNNEEFGGEKYVPRRSRLLSNIVVFFRRKRGATCLFQIAKFHCSIRGLFRYFRWTDYFSGRTPFCTRLLPLFFISLYSVAKNLHESSSFFLYSLYIREEI